MHSESVAAAWNQRDSGSTRRSGGGISDSAIVVAAGEAVAAVRSRDKPKAARSGSQMPKDSWAAAPKVRLASLR